MLDGVSLYQDLTRIIQENDFAGCDALLANFNVAETNLSVCLAMLMGTVKMPRDRIPSRGQFFNQVRDKYVREIGESEAVIALESLHQSNP